MYRVLSFEHKNKRSKIIKWTFGELIKYKKIEDNGESCEYVVEIVNEN